MQEVAETDERQAHRIERRVRVGRQAIGQIGQSYEHGELNIDVRERVIGVGNRSRTCDEGIRNRNPSDGFSRIVAGITQMVGHSVSLGGSMPDARNQAEHYRKVAEEYRRLASSSSTQMRDPYLRMAEHYSKLAEAEEQSAQPRRNRG